MLIKINGRTVFTNRVTKVALVRPGHYVAVDGSSEFQIEGGYHAGGARTDWFVSGGWINGSIAATSLRDAVRIIDNA